MQNNQEKIDLSLIVNIHREAKYLSRTFRSLHDACYELLRNEIKLELVVVLDNSDKLTRSVAKKWIGTLPVPSKTVEIKHANFDPIPFAEPVRTIVQAGLIRSHLPSQSER